MALHRRAFSERFIVSLYRSALLQRLVITLLGDLPLRNDDRFAWRFGELSAVLQSVDTNEEFGERHAHGVRGSQTDR